MLKFNIIMIGIITILHVYVFSRILTISWIQSILPLKAWICIAILLWLFFFASRTIALTHTGSFYTWIEWAGMAWMGIVFLLFVPLLISDIFTLFGFLGSSYVPYIRSAALFIGILLSITALIQGTRYPVVTTYHIYVPSLSASLDETKIIALTDTHFGNLLGEKWFRHVSNQIMEEKPDAIVLVGDIFEGFSELPDHYQDIFQSLSAPLGLWGVLGNHDNQKNKNGHYLLEETNATLLLNSAIEITPGLVLAGVEDITFFINTDRARAAIENTLQNRPEGVTIYLSHVPWGMDIAEKEGVNLMISGHTHGGQLWPFTYLVRNAFPQYNGYYRIGNMDLIVSRGTGT